MLLIGDVHGHATRLHALLRAYPDNDIWQVGDMGFGFGAAIDAAFADLPERFRFIRGNHDKPATCHAHPNHLGDYGYHESRGTFFMGGAWSIDRAYRVEGVSWWPDEELSYAQFEAAIALAREVQPRILVTHDCPGSVFQSMFPVKPCYPNRTVQALDALQKVCAPEKWYFGHHHVSWSGQVGSTAYRCLDELEVVEVDLIPKPDSPAGHRLPGS